jgi:acetyltransferase-like isoleucine patch superfamily enzyme
VLEIVLTREDANTEFALLAEWLVEDRQEVIGGQAVCVVETTKATVEIESPGAGTLVQLFGDGVEVELGRTIALVAQDAEELEGALARREPTLAAETTPRPGDRKVTKKAVALAERHEIDLTAIDKRGFITEKDVEAAIARQTATAGPSGQSALAGVSTEGVSLPASFELEEGLGTLDAEFLESLRSDSERFRALPSDEKLTQYRDHGAAIGEDVVLGPGAIVVAPRIVVENGVELESGTTIWCEEVVAIGALTRFGANAELRCRRAFLGSNVWVGRTARFGGGGHRDPWAVLAIGDLAYIGDEAYVNVCRPVLIGREAFVTMRSLIVTHNIGHSLLEGFENRFAPVVLEDRAQVGLGTVLYAGCRIGAEAIVASNSYVVADVPAGAFAIGVPAKVTGSAKHQLSRQRQIELARKMLDELHELLALKGHDVSAIEDGEVRRFEVRTADGTALVLFTPAFRDSADLDTVTEAVVLTLESSSEDLPAGTAVLDLVGRRIDGSGGVVLDSVREFCRKRGIRFEPGPWRYRGGLV